MFESLNCLLVIVALAVIAIPIVSSIKIVPEHQRLVVFRLGRPLEKPKGPGLVILFPFVDRVTKVDLGKQMREVLDVEAETEDGKLVTLSFRWYYKVVDPVKSIHVVLDPKSQKYIFSNYETFIANTALNVFQSAIHEVNGSDLVLERERVRNMVYARLDEMAQKFGIKIVRLEITNFALKEGASSRA